jgi:hypothetical protein
MSNWTDFLAIHQARQLYPKDTHLFGPYLAALHGGVDWTTPQIDGATAFFHAEVLLMNYLNMFDPRLAPLGP